MRPTGALHLGHYHGALKNWVRLQDQYDCFYFVADWHALTTHYDDREVIEKHRLRHGDRLARRRPRPRRATIFIQSRLPEHAELFTLLAMGTPLGWLERVPTYKDQIEKLKDRDLATYGFLGYPLLQAADILIYKAAYVPVGEDQASHVELTREVARRFNHLYGRGQLRSKGRRHARRAEQGRPALFEKQAQDLRWTGSDEALAKGEAVINRAPPRSAGARTTPSCRRPARHRQDDPHRAAALHTEVLQPARPRRPKMSKSYGNAIAMREPPAEVERIEDTACGDPQGHALSGAAARGPGGGSSTCSTSWPPRPAGMCPWRRTGRPTTALVLGDAGEPGRPRQGRLPPSPWRDRRRHRRRTRAGTTSGPPGPQP